LLHFRLLLLAVGALAKRSELARHLLDLLGEVGQLTSDACYVLLGGGLSGILRPWKPKFDLRLELDWRLFVWPGNGRGPLGPDSNVSSAEVPQRRVERLPALQYGLEQVTVPFHSG